MQLTYLLQKTLFDVSILNSTTSWVTFLCWQAAADSRQCICKSKCKRLLYRFLTILCLCPEGILNCCNLFLFALSPLFVFHLFSYSCPWSLFVVHFYFIEMSIKINTNITWMEIQNVSLQMIGRQYHFRTVAYWESYPGTFATQWPQNKNHEYW